MNTFYLEVGFFLLSFPALYYVARREPEFVRRVLLAGLGALTVATVAVVATGVVAISVHGRSAHWFVVMYWVVFPVACAFSLSVVGGARSWRGVRARFRRDSGRAVR